MTPPCSGCIWAAEPLGESNLRTLLDKPDPWLHAVQLQQPETELLMFSEWVTPKPKQNLPSNGFLTSCLIQSWNRKSNRSAAGRSTRTWVIQRGWFSSYLPQIDGAMNWIGGKKKNRRNSRKGSGAVGLLKTKWWQEKLEQFSERHLGASRLLLE